MRSGCYNNSRWMSLGVVRLVFNSNYTVSVYKDGQYLYKVPVYVCNGPLITCGSGPWAPAQKLVIPVSWGPNGVAMGVARFIHIPNDVGYGLGLTYVYGMQTVAMPFYYRYNLTGAYPYRLEVRIDTAEKKIAEANGWIYINMTYSGYLKLYLGDKLVAYDALYGWTIRQDQAPHPPYTMESQVRQAGRASRRKPRNWCAYNTATCRKAITATRRRCRWSTRCTNLDAA